MKENESKLKGSKNIRLFVIIIAAAIAIGIGVAIVLANFAVQNPDNPQNSRTVFWRHIHGLGIEPVDRNVLYIATHGDFYHSVDGGPPVKVDEQRADYMAFNAPYSQGVPLYASGHPSTGGNTGLIKSTDGGKTWETVATILEPPVDFHAMSVSKSNPTILIGFDSANRGLFKTIDAGLNWQKLNPPDYVSALAISPTDPNVVFAGSGNGIYQSSDGANTWTPIEPLKRNVIFALTFDEEGVLYAATEQLGLSRSFDLGQNWEKVNNPTLTIMSIAIDAQNKIFYVAGYSPDGFQEVYKSSDDGTSWDLIGTNKEL
ncbi:MAG: F510_1955 family glycosylhydrolase [Nitrososphaerota archaeon]